MKSACVHTTSTYMRRAREVSLNWKQNMHEHFCCENCWDIELNRTNEDKK